ncbi:hypothetical protein BKF98_RS23320 [Vibrio parahaemolyticus]|nr:hypothetical protein [Vibrio parahaemolyticus]EJG1862138.1 hypothetical protein [Vibrio parahaemolyticus]
MLSWIDRESITVHKNQTWYSLVQQHDRWIAELNAHRQAQDEELDMTTWEGAQWTLFDTQGITIEEITEGKTHVRACREPVVQANQCLCG